MTFLDSNVVIWLYFNQLGLFSKKVVRHLENDDLYISPFVKLELEYLHEVKRLEPSSDEIIDALHKEIGLNMTDGSVVEIVSKANDIKWTRDPFDRLIVAHAKVLSAILLTKDRKILKNFNNATW